MMILTITTLGILLSLISFGNLSDGPSRPVAKVGKTIIDTHDVHTRLNRLPQNPQTTQKDRYEWALNQLIDEAILIYQAKKTGLHRTKEYADNLETVKNTLLLELMIARLLENYPGVSDAKVNQFYQTNAALFDSIHQRRFQYSVSDTQSEASKIYAQLTQNPSAVPWTHGGWITHNHPDSALAKTVFSLKTIGDIAPPVQTQTGYYVIQLIGINQTPTQPKADSLKLIRAELDFEQREAFIDAYINQSRDGVTVHRY